MKKKLLTTLVLALAVFGAFTLVSNAASGLQEIKAYLDSSVTITMEGEPQTFLDANGSRVYPISYNGTTYLPVRAVAGLVGLDVDWDQATRTVLLGKQPSGVDLIDTYKYYAANDDYSNGSGRQFQTGDEDPMDISGIKCSHWLQLSREWHSGDEKTTTNISFNLAGKHDTLTFSYYADMDMVLRVLGDNDTVLFEKAVTGTQVAQTATIPLFKTTQITFQITNIPYQSNATKCYIFNAYLDAEE